MVRGSTKPQMAKVEMRWYPISQQLLRRIDFAIGHLTFATTLAPKLTSDFQTSTGSKLRIFFN
jgi:hypothetical protein